AVYHVHVGIYAPQLPGGPRLLDVYAGELKVDPAAAPSQVTGPEPLSGAEVAKRQRNLAFRIKAGVSLDGPGYRFTVDRSSGAWQLLDKKTGVLWASQPDQPIFGTVRLSDGQMTRSFAIRRFDEIERTRSGLALVVRPQIDNKPTGLTLTFRVRPVGDPAGIEIAYSVSGASGYRVVSVTILENALWTTEADGGYSVLPVRLGVMVPASEGLPSVRRMLTYSDTSMAFYGAVRQGSALLVAWPHCDTELVFAHTWLDNPMVGGRRMNSISLTLVPPADSCTIHPLGRGDYCDIARAYRRIAARRGFVKTWAQKRRECPNVDKLIGAADFKPFVFVRVLPREPGGQEGLHIGFSFSEVAQCAEHWRKDLGIDRAMVVLAGWIHRGYDNQHPDILPACPECGGNEELAKAAMRIKQLGFLFGLHDNYQDIYRDAPSWDEKYINRDAHGNLKLGGYWAGGQAYQVCAIKQVELARRPQNLPAVKRLFDPTIYFIDTTFAWGLVTCEAPDHPMTRADDMKYKSLLCDEAKKHFGLFGSEEGREWAVPHADYFEGIFSHKASGDPREIVVPVMPMVYGDCVMLYTHQGDRLGPWDAKKVLDHILYAAMPVYHFGNHLYWTQPEPCGVPVVPLPPFVEPAGQRSFRITYRWRVEEKIGDDYMCFVHFTHPKATRPEGIAYQNDHTFAVPTSRWQPGSVVEDGPYTVEVPEQFLGESQVWLGLLDRNGARMPIGSFEGSGGRYFLGTLITGPDQVSFRPAELHPVQKPFARADGGWGQNLGETDRFIKNTYEVLSYLQRVTADNPMTRHAFVTADRSVEQTVFGDGKVRVTVNYGPEEYVIGSTVLPKFGFLVESGTFLAFHASRFAGRTYQPPALFTIRSLDDRPINKSGRLRIYHGFGDPHIVVNGKEYVVEREQVVQLRPGQ
ncbi:MAG: DUF5696 domain-containing protein, partial [Armatimonadetes bacterium]|nr:DUF5696 domain-containing protein [Armatimonadota bacterium]